jgi:hypothetical protein
MAAGRSRQEVDTMGRFVRPRRNSQLKPLFGRRWRLGVLRLEDRITPSGELVTAPIGALPAGHTARVTFDATVDSPLTKGITQTFNTGSISGTGFTTFSTGTATNNNTPTSTTVDRAPAVSAVFVNGTTRPSAPPWAT